VNESILIAAFRYNNHKNQEILIGITVGDRANKQEDRAMNNKKYEKL
jgi:hypothetical protein